MKRSWKWNFPVHIHEAELKIEMGARCNIIKLNLLKRIRCEQKIDKPKSVNLTTYGGTQYSTLGTVKLNCQINSAQYQLEFHNVDKLATSHFGLKDSLKMKLIKVNKESTKSMPAVSSKNNFLVRTKICLMTILASYQQFTQWN